MVPPAASGPLLKTIALVRVATGLLFLLFGQFKVFGPWFVQSGMQEYVSRYVEQNQAVSFYKVFLAQVVLPRAELFGYLVGGGELLIGIALVLGFWVRPASVAGALHMLSLTLASWHAPGAEAPLWRFFAAQLDHLGLLFLFLIFGAGNAGRVWGLDALRDRQAKSD